MKTFGLLKYSTDSDQRFGAFTLVEMLLVMAILLILSTLSISAFMGLRRSIVLNETTTSFQQVVRNTQRAAMLLSRNASEKWMYGTGIDLRNIEGVDGYYTTFKWCSPFNNYGEDYLNISYVYSTSKFPAYNPKLPLSNPLIGGTNGTFPISSEAEDCGITENFLVANGVYLVTRDEISRQIKSPVSATLRNAAGGSDNKIAFIVFESISGRAFFYNDSGEILNYDQTGAMNPTPFDFEIVFTAENSPTDLVIGVKNVSGKVSLNRESRNEG